MQLTKTLDHNSKGHSYRTPFTFGATDYDKNLCEPAINETIFLLKAIKEHNPSIKRRVITSQLAANLDS